MNTFRKGFTVVEVMIIVIIIGLLTAMAFPAFQKVKRENAQAAIEMVDANPSPSRNDDRFTFERMNNVALAGGAYCRVLLLTDKTTGKQFLMVEDFGVADLNVVKIEASSRFGR